MPKTAKAETPKLSPSGLAGHLRDAILEIVQDQRVIWREMPAAEQKAYIENAGRTALELIDGCLDCILVDGDGVVVEASANDVVFKKESIQTKINVQYEGENAELLRSAAHKPVKLVFAPQRDKVRDLGETPEPDLDQPEMFATPEEVMSAPPTSAKVEESTKTKRGARRLKLAE